MKIGLSQGKLVQAKQTIDSVKKELDIAKNFDNDKVDINCSKGEVDITHNPYGASTQIIDTDYKEKLYSAKVSYNPETGDIKEGRVSTSQQLREWGQENSYIDGVFYAIGGGERFEKGESDLSYSLKESKYEEIAEKNKCIYTQFQDDRDKKEIFSRVEINKKTGDIIDVEIKKGDSALKKARKEFSNIDEKRLILNSTDPEFKTGKFTNKELNIAFDAIERVKDDFELAKLYDNAKGNEAINSAAGKDRDEKTGEIKLDNTDFEGENDITGRYGYGPRRIVKNARLSYDPLTGDIKEGKVSTYRRLPGPFSSGVSWYQEKKNFFTGREISVYFNRESYECVWATAVEVDKETGEILKIKHYNSSEKGKPFLSEEKDVTPSAYLDYLKKEEKEKRENQLKEDKKAEEIKYNEKRNEFASEMKRRIEIASKEILKYDNSKADLNPESGRIEMNSSSRLINQWGGEYSPYINMVEGGYGESVNEAKVSFNSETGDLESMYIKTKNSYQESIYEYGYENGNPYYSNNEIYREEKIYSGKAVFNRETGALIDTKQWHSERISPEYYVPERKG